MIFSMADSISIALRLFFEMTSIPITATLSGRKVLLPETPVRFLYEEAGMDEEKTDSPACAVEQSAESHGVYARLRLPQGQICLGPVFLVAPDERNLAGVMREMLIIGALREQTLTMLTDTPRLNGEHMRAATALLAFLLTGEEQKVALRLLPEQEGEQEQERFLKARTQTQYSGSFHDTYRFEQQLYNLIGHGDTRRLTEFLSNTRTIPQGVGTVADSPLRQAKNLLLGTITKVGMLAAIPAGLDVETTYEMIDDFSRRCERCTNTAQIERLDLEMLLAFCRRIGQARLPGGLSPEIYRAACFIRDRTNSRLTVSRVAASINRSESFLTRRFRAEMGTSVARFITDAKMRDAASLLRYSSRSISGIASFLAYSSQSYFQTVFKSYWHETPAHYRRSHATSADGRQETPEGILTPGSRQ